MPDYLINAWDWWKVNPCTIIHSQNHAGMVAPTAVCYHAKYHFRVNSNFNYMLKSVEDNILAAFCPKTKTK